MCSRTLLQEIFCQPGSSVMMGTKLFSQKTDVALTKNGVTTLSGERNETNGMWYVNLLSPKSPANIANFVLPYKPVQNTIKFMHAACFSPCLSTWCKAIDQGFFKS